MFESLYVMDAEFRGERRKSREMAIMMRNDGKPEEEVKRYTGFTFRELDAPKTQVLNHPKE